MDLYSSKSTKIDNTKKQILTFLGMTFLMTYGTNLIMYLNYGSIINEGSLQQIKYIGLQMFYPAFCAIVCKFIFEGKNLNKSTKSVFKYYIFASLIIFIAAILSPILNNLFFKGKEMGFYVQQILGIIFSIIGSIIIFNKDRNELKENKLHWGENSKLNIIIPIIFALVIIIISLIDYYAGFGKPDKNFNPLIAIGNIPIILLGAFFSWIFFFGEEYGWRVYLQDRLIGIYGKVRGVFILGTIWGLWHAPIIIMGYNFPNHPFIGVIMMIIYTISIGIIISFSVFKTGSVWVAVIIHYMNNNLQPYVTQYICTPNEKCFSFIGILMTIMLSAAISLPLLKCKEYKGEKDIAI